MQGPCRDLQRIMSKQKTIYAISEGNRHTNGQQRSDTTIAEKNEMNENKR